MAKVFKAFIAALWLGLCCWVGMACAPTVLAPPIAQSPAITTASVVTLVTPQARWAFAPLSADNWTDAGYRLRYVPSCNAFAIERDGAQLLVTANHCTVGVALGGELRYLSPNGVGYGIAKLLSRNEAKDLAIAEAGGLVALPTAEPPGTGAEVLSVSSFYENVSYGRVVDRLASGYYETSQTIIHGWSGSPVLDTQGRVWGVVCRCPQPEGAKDCEPGRTIVSALEGE